MQTLSHNKENYFKDDPGDGEQFDRRVDAPQFVGRFLKDHLDKLPNGTVLEAGCGPGALANEVAKKYANLSVTGIDIREDRIKQANEKTAGLKNANAVIGSVYRLPFPDNHFDLIYARFLFQNLREPIVATKELHRVCKPGGKLLLQDLDGQFTFYPEPLFDLSDVLEVMKNETGFDPDVGRKLFSYGEAAGLSFLNVTTDLYHSVFHKAEAVNNGLRDLNLKIAFKHLQGTLGEKRAEKLKTNILSALEDEDTVLLSTLFTMTFTK